VATYYYDLVGALRATPLQKGIYIVKTIYKSGKTKANKLIINN